MLKISYYIKLFGFISFILLRQTPRMRCSLNLPILLTMTLILHIVRWWPIVFPPSINSIINYLRGSNPGAYVSLIPYKLILNDTPKGLPLIQVTTFW